MIYIRKSFEDHCLVYMPSHCEQDSDWLSPSKCVWSAPNWFTVKQRLNGITNYAGKTHLFRFILRIVDAGSEEYLKELQAMKEDSGTGEKVKAIYHHIWREYEHDSQWEKLRYVPILELLEMLIWIGNPSRRKI